MKHVLLFASITLASGLLFTNIYNSMIDAQSWGSNIPQSIDVARNYFHSVNPGNFFRIFSPLNQLLALLVLVLFWKGTPNIRIYLGIALILFVLCDAFTFAYFYPRNDLMFKDAPLTAIDTLRNAWTGWNTMNWVRSLMIFTGVCFSFTALHKLYTSR